MNRKVIGADRRSDRARQLARKVRQVNIGQPAAGIAKQMVMFFGHAIEAVRAAVKDYYDKNGIAYDPEKFQIHDCEHCHD